MEKKLEGITIYDYDEIHVASSVTEITDFNFYKHENLIYVSLPDGLERIGIGAFCGCKNIFRMHIPNNVTCVDDGAFYECENLYNIKLSENCTKINDQTFYKCSRLNNIEIPYDYTEIGEESFAYCSTLTDIFIPYTVTKIGASAFFECEALRYIELPELLTEIGNGAFMFCKNLRSILVSSKELTIIPDSFCKSCEKLQKAILKPNINTIKASAFENCKKLYYVELPYTLKEIGNAAFKNCINLHTIYFTGSRTEWDAIPKGIDWDLNVPKDIEIICAGDKSYFEFENGNREELDIHDIITYDEKFKDAISIKLGDSISIIGGRAFANCTKLKTLYVSNYLKRIGYFAFLNCENLTDIYYNGTKAEWNNVVKHIDKYNNIATFNEWYEEIASNNYGSFTVHCNDGKLTYIDDSFYIVTCYYDELNNMRIIDIIETLHEKVTDYALIPEIDGMVYESNAIHKHALCLIYKKIEK